MKIKGYEDVPTIFEMDNNEVVGILRCNTHETENGNEFSSVLVWNFTQNCLQQYPFEEGYEKWTIFLDPLTIWN